MITADWLNVVLAGVNIVVTAFIALAVHRASKRSARMEHDRGIKDAWINIDMAALQDPDNMRLLDQLIHADQQGADPDASRRRWLAYMVLNPLEAAWSGAKFGHLPDAVLDSSERTMRGLVQHDDVYALIQGFVYSMEFRARCAELRKAWQEDSARLAQRAPAVHADHLPGDVAG
ncbi:MULTISPECIES: hypothetical protein [unclassified Pseudoxanthomonas]|jgi:hypothetical protein|uniref:hypothetical protein n=1 Tax=unclassified Pseudoxanthomonas TaxID=2645906 RepID=UPI00307F8682